ncbi:hypothetical protein [Ancylobacter oerskovii]|uniref:Uncharacterized protein n=2 Tax=Ancylobacter oerskovii TaxID=459519 RepID=A0ABW4YV58_9HYPH
MLNRLRKMTQAEEDKDVGAMVVVEVRDRHREEDYATEVARLERDGKRITERTPVIILRRFSEVTFR